MKVGIPKYTHNCFPDGGDYHCEVVEDYHYKDGDKCGNCGQPLATTDQIVAHIYSHLTE